MCSMVWYTYITPTIYIFQLIYRFVLALQQCSIRQDIRFNFGTKWCAPRQVDSEIIYILRMKILPAYHMVLGAMQPVDGHGLP